METSDSEYFESADEDIQSDEENTKSVKSVNKKTDSESIKTATTQLKTVKLEETDSALNNNKSLSDKTDFVKIDDENNIETSGVKKINKKEVKKLDNKKNKLGSLEVSTGSKETVILQEKTETVKDVKNDEIVCKPQEKDNTEIKDDNSDENLWDEAEIDWGKEAEKEKEENLWENEDWEPVESPPQKLEEKPQTPASWGSWGNWGGVSSILSTATQGVSTITQGITNVLETGIGVPDPEELARINQAEKEKVEENREIGDDDRNSGFGLGNLVMGVSHLTKLVETTGTKVISGGLGTLETIGKKTMEVLQEGDPGLKKKRAFLTIDQEKPVLSQLLREAKEKAENENKILEQKHFAKKAKNYETLFDDHQGLVHLEALEMLSKQCDIKLQTLMESHSGDSLIEMQETMDQVKELCELPDEEDEEQSNWREISEKLNCAVSEINIPISYKKLIETWEETETWLNNLKLEVCDERELHQQAVETLAQLTAIAVEQFHKTGELLLVKEHRSTADEADSLVQLTTSLTALIGIVAAKFSDKLNAKSTNSKNKEEVNGLITNVFFEAANSSSYIQDAFQLLIPVLQVGAV